MSPASGGYFEIGNVFHKQDRIDLTNSYYDKVVNIWKTTLKGTQIKLGKIGVQCPHE